MSKQNKMTIEVWSDIACPFCYIGKKKLEKAISGFKQSGRIKVIWKSFELNPDIITNDTISLNDFLAREKNWSHEYIDQSHKRIAESGNEYGIIYNFDKAIPANTMKAHVLLHIAKKYEMQTEVKEKLFRAYFTEGKNVDDYSVLGEIARNTGIDYSEFEQMAENEEMVNEVRLDRYEASQLGIRGVPFFIFNNKYAISGAHPDLLFSETLQKSYSDWENAAESSPAAFESGESCTIDGECN